MTDFHLPAAHRWVWCYVSLLLLVVGLPKAQGQDFIPEPPIIYFGVAPDGQIVQVQRGVGVAPDEAVLVSNLAGSDGYVARVNLVAPVTNPAPTPPGGSAYAGTRATVSVNGVAQGQVVLDERGAIYQLDFPSPARTPSPNAILAPLRIVPVAPTPPSCGLVTCTPSSTPTVTASPTRTTSPTLTATPTATPTSAIVAGSVGLEGRPSAPDPKWQVPLRVSLTHAGQLTPFAQYTPTTDQSGGFRIEGVDPGAYEIRVKNAKTLQIEKDVTLTSGVNTIAFGTLRAGDANDDNVVNLIDFSILRTTFGLAAGQAGYDARADFNDNNQVNLLDFSLMRPNFSQLGAHAHHVGESSAASDSVAAAAAEVKPTPQVQIGVIVPAGTIAAGQHFTVDVEVRAGTQEVDGVAVYLDYDPGVLHVTGITAGNALPTVLQSQSDTPGTLSFAAGTFAKFPSGTFTLAQINMEALADAGGSRLDLVRVVGRESDASFAGDSVLASVHSATIGVGTDDFGTPGGSVTGAGDQPVPTATATASPTPDEAAQPAASGLTTTETEATSSSSACQVDPARQDSFGLGLLLGGIALLARRKALTSLSRIKRGRGQG